MKKTLAILLAAAVAAGTLTACGGSKQTETQAAKTEETKAEETKAEETKAAGNETTELKTLTVGASPAPHAEILEAAKELMAEKGYDLVIKEYTDYVQPNLALDSGDLDANYFQHLPYLEQFNQEKGTKLVSAGAVHYEPFGIYAGQKKSLDELAEKDKVAVPNDATNEARALLLLQDQGLITLKDGVGLEATKNDIVENTKNLEILEIEAAQIPRSLQDVSIAVINGNYAIEAGLKVADALATEDASSVAAQTFGNIVAVKEGNENNEEIKTLLEVLKGDEIKKFINDTYAGAVVPLD